MQQTKREMMGKIKFIEEFAPLLVFFLLNAYGAQWLGRPDEDSLFIATGGFMLALIIAIISALARGHRPNNMTIISAAFVLIFGALTLFLRDETFIKIKPTMIYILLAGLLGWGLVRGQFYLRLLMGNMVALTHTGWHKLTLRWIGFFVVLAMLNEIIWRTQSTDIWVNFKVFGILSLTFIFIVAQMPLFKNHALPRTDKKDGL